MYVLECFYETAYYKTTKDAIFIHDTIALVEKESKLRRNVGGKYFGRLAINCQICQSFLLLMFCTIQYVVYVAQH